MNIIYEVGFFTLARCCTIFFREGLLKYPAKIKKTAFGLFLSVLSVCGSAEDEVPKNEWEFSLNPIPHLSKYGNVTRSHKLIIQVDENCRGAMEAYFSSHNKIELLKSKGQTLPIELSVSLFSHTEVIKSDSKVTWVDDMVREGVEMPFAFSTLELVALDHIDQLKPLGIYEMTTFNLAAGDDKIYDNPHENWDLNGFLPALTQAVSWCRSMERINLQHKTSNVIYYL